MDRRHFIAGLAGGTIVLAAGGRVASTTQQDAVIAVLRKRLDYLCIDEPGARRFADDLVAHATVSGVRLRVLAALAPLYLRVPLTGNQDWKQLIRHGEEHITTAFLLSSDFFRNSRQESLPVRYLGFYDPWHNPVACGSPFARPLPGAGMPRSSPPQAWPAAAAGAAAAAER